MMNEMELTFFCFGLICRYAVGDREVEQVRKLMTAGFAFAAATVISYYFLSGAWPLFCCALSAAAAFAGLLLRGKARLRALIAGFSLAAGFLWCWLYPALFVAPSGNLHGETIAVTATVKEFPKASGRGHYANVSVHRDGAPSIGARLYYYTGDELRPGDVISFTARFVRNDGAEDRERIDSLVSKGAFLSAYLSGEIAVTGSAGRLRYFPARLGEATAGMIDRLYPGDVAPFMKALLVGQRDELSGNATLTSSLSASGISHVVAISGMHVSFLMSFLAIAVKNKRLFSLIGIPVLLIFMAMTGFTPSVTRAGIMQLLIICAPAFKRESDGLTSLSAALLILLIANPYSCASASLQLSFAATLGIQLFSGRIDAAFTAYLSDYGFDITRKRVKKRSKGERLPARLKGKVRELIGSGRATKALARFIATSFATTIGALVLTIPLSAYHFGQVSLVAPLTNLLTLWAVSVAFPAGIVSCVLGYIYIPLGTAVARLVSFCARYIISVARVFSALPYSSVYASFSPLIIWLVYVYVMFIVMPFIKAKSRQYLIAACLSIVTLCAVLLTASLSSGVKDASITILDVGQGQSIAMLSGDYSALIDCGSSSTSSAGEVAHEFFSNAGRTSIDIMILTHFHSDHANGVEYMLSRLAVSTLAIPDPEGSYLADDIIELARKRGTDIMYVTETMRVTLGDIEFVLYPPMSSGGENERGLSILCLGGVSALITGDMPASSERALLRFAQLPKVDLLVAGHHGSRYSTSEELLAALEPAIAIISVGRNSYGHPSGETLGRLDDFGVPYLRTDEQGSITVSAAQKGSISVQQGTEH